MAVIAWLSGDQFSDEQSAAWLARLPFVAALGLSPTVIDTANLILRKSTHFVEYAALAMLVWRAIGMAAARPSSSGRLLGALLVGVGYATLDELHQALTATRSGTVHDVLIDSLGAAAGALVAAVLGLAAARPARVAGPTPPRHAR
jgi:VanZ family protein